MGKRKYNEVKEYRKPTDAPLFFIGTHIYSYNGITHTCHMPLTADNDLPSINIRFGSTHNHSEISFVSHIDYCATMNVGDLKIHQLVITTHP